MSGSQLRSRLVFVLCHCWRSRHFNCIIMFLILLYVSWPCFLRLPKPSVSLVDGRNEGKEQHQHVIHSMWLLGGALFSLCVDRLTIRHWESMLMKQDIVFVLLSSSHLGRKHRNTKAHTHTHTQSQQHPQPHWHIPSADMAWYERSWHDRWHGMEWNRMMAPYLAGPKPRSAEVEARAGSGCYHLHFISFHLVSFHVICLCRLKVKKDYVSGLALCDSVDVVPIGAWWGNGTCYMHYTPHRSTAKHSSPSWCAKAPHALFNRTACSDGAVHSHWWCGYLLLLMM